MKTPLNFKSAKMLAICLTALLVAGCSSDEELRMEAAEEQSINKCIEMDGLPVRSLWDGRLVDCIFKPK